MTSIQEFNCILCKETFENKEDLQIHFRKHGDPEFNKSVKKSRPQCEAQASVAKKYDDTEMVSCDVCSEMFPTISKAITHKHKMHPDHDAKYFCPWCGKLFTMKHLYNKHLQSNHVDSEQSEDSHFHCDVCDVDFFVPTAMLYHNKFFHRQDTELPSIGQSKKLKMYSQNTVLQIYYCSFCGEEYDNKVNLHKHVNDDHSDENQSPEDVLRCPLCDAIFYHLDAYELHLTFHTSEDLYSEKNEMFEQLTEFSLETVAPVMEKVENVESQDAETEINAVGLENFLELAMHNSLDGKHKVKSKKHKKHKKSKKAAITLDEFLNMNKDVFGEGLDFQGVEEVPTQVVKKRLKQTKPTKANIKALESSNLEKLKKQGIIVKIKPGKVATMQKTNLGTKMLTKIPTSEVKPSSRIQTSSEEVLSKLISQSNNQIKIVKKSSQENVDGQNKSAIVDNNSFHQRGLTPENIEVECDVNMPSEYTSSENEAREEITRKENVTTSKKPTISNQSNLDGFHNDENCKEERETDAVNEEKKDAISEDKMDSVNEDEKLGFDKEEPDDLSQSKILSNEIKSQKSISEKPILPTLPDDDNHNHDMTMGESKNKTENYLEINTKSPEQQTTKSLNALKHLSHLITVKSVTKTNSAPPSPVQKFKDQKDSRIVETEDVVNEDHKIQTPNHEKEITEMNEKPVLNKLEHLKRLSNNITIKSLPQSLKNANDNSDADEEESEHENASSNVFVTNKSATPINNLESKPLISPKTYDKLQSVKPTVEKESTKPSNVDLLKHLTNVTAKPVNAKGNNIQQSTKATISNMPCTVKKNLVQNYVKKETSEEVEIFNIDDSDDEPDKVQQPLIKTSPLSPKDNMTENVSAHSVEKFKNIGKQITVKSTNQQATLQRKSNLQKPKSEDMLSKLQRSMAEFSDNDDDTEDRQNNLTLKKVSDLNQKQDIQNDHIKNTLKNLGKHITVKSGIPSPNLSIRSVKDREDKFDQAGDSDSDPDSAGVKISEITEEHAMSEGDMAEQEANLSDFFSVKPGEAFSDDEDQHFDDSDDDLEHQIKTTTVKRPNPNITAQMLNLQNMNKNITIKSMSEKKDSTLKDGEIIPKTKPNIKNEISKQPFKQFKTESRDATDPVDSKMLKNTLQVAQNRSNQNIASCSQQNTVNKEVTVKTIQTKTVIQEITTTVTKTIKTVNQTIKQEQSVQSSSQNNQIMFQKVQGMKSANLGKNYQGVTVRHATPVAGAKVKGPGTLNRPTIGAVRPANKLVPVRPSNQMVPVRASNQMVPVRPSNQIVPVRPSNQIVPVRPSNQIVPVRPSNQIVPVRPANQLAPMRPAMNTARMSRPRMSGPKKAMPGNQQKSPHAINTAKRPVEEPAGHFSCFKKPKESLIPVSDIPSFSSGEAIVQYSSSHISQSNFTSATKTGYKMVTSTQMKSETSSSSQQLERLNSMSGLKIVKTSQMTQATKVEEKCGTSEHSTSKRNTLDAIEKLRKQGLLIKKPRLHTSNDSDHSDEDNNSYITEEPDDD